MLSGTGNDVVRIEESKATLILELDLIDPKPSARQIDVAPVRGRPLAPQKADHTRVGNTQLHHILRELRRSLNSFRTFAYQHPRRRAQTDFRNAQHFLHITKCDRRRRTKNQLERRAFHADAPRIVAIHCGVRDCDVRVWFGECELHVVVGHARWRILRHLRRSLRQRYPDRRRAKKTFPATGTRPAGTS